MMEERFGIFKAIFKRRRLSLISSDIVFHASTCILQQGQKKIYIYLTYILEYYSFVIVW